MLQCFGGGEHGLLGLARVATIDQHVAGQPVELAEKRHPLEAFLADAHGAFRDHLAQHVEVVVGLMVSDDHTGALMIAQSFGGGIHLDIQQAQGWPGIQARAQAAVVRVERTAQAENQAERAGDQKVYAHHRHTQGKQHGYSPKWQEKGAQCTGVR